LQSGAKHEVDEIKDDDLAWWDNVVDIVLAFAEVAILFDCIAVSLFG
jgi:hypothetical protein